MDNLIKRIKSLLDGNTEDSVFYRITRNGEIVEVQERLTKKIDELVKDLSVLDYKARNLEFNIHTGFDSVPYKKKGILKALHIKKWYIEVTITDDNNLVLNSDKFYYDPFRTTHCKLLF